MTIPHKAPIAVKTNTARMGGIPLRPDSGGSVARDIAGLILRAIAKSDDKKHGNQIGIRYVSILVIDFLP